MNPQSNDKEMLAESVKTMMEQIGFGTDDARIKMLLAPTPRSAIYKRKGQGGGMFDYVRGGWVKERLNIIFMFQWDFELVPMENGQYFQTTGGQVIVLGKLTIKDLSGNPRLIKMGTGKKEILYMKDETGRPSAKPVDIGNTIKSAETDALKRCAVQIGIGLDLYNKTME